MKVPTNIEDFDLDDPDIEFRKKRWDYWGALKNIRGEYYDSLAPNVLAAIRDELDLNKFGEFVREKYGIQLIVVDGRITDKFDIVDEKLYTYFLLKWK